MFTLRRVVKVRLVMDRDGGVTGTQSLINTKNFGHFYRILINSFQTFQPILIIYSDKFVSRQWECKLIYHPLSYSLRSLVLDDTVSNYICSC